MNAINKEPARSEDIRALDAEHHLHPFTDTHALNAKGARVIERAEGVYLWDSEGNRIIDGMAGLWCVNIGYGRKELAEAAYTQMNQLPYYNTFFQTTTSPATQLAKELAVLTPGDLNHIFFANSGSEAIDTVIRMVRRYWEVMGKPWRKTLIARNNAYHGSTIGGTSLGGMGAMHNQGGPFLPGIEHIRQPYWYGEADGQSPETFALTCAQALEEKILEVGPDNVAAFVGEPIQGAGGVIVPPEGYWAEIQKICRKYDILLVADEVICGFGRTGNWFGSQTLDIKPDLISMAKGLSSGYQPISAVAVGERVASALIEKGGEFYHGFTYSGHPVAAAVALENLRILREEKIIEQVRDVTGPYLQQQLRERLGNHPLVGHIEGVGLIAGMALAQDKAQHKLFDSNLDVGTICRNHCFANGLIMRACGNRMVLSPPLVITKAEIDEMLDKALLCLDLTVASLKEMGVTLGS
ncbi:Omega-amino acid--pyruvate aminotransferase [Marinobacterium lacunae]|uniref:Omega-amino acid--pyruvate aminotransferase n=1 Tax=Marinobacterium lacunae TaxID=1232683 RepID=A0A081FXA8_9GAMM|nr:aspartate aminotransferase family protein [Marinobacterium lacunae]KEA63163.1 Omega-amino acid--pyruvate aminotransferase [Marinobacterium lacunae]